MFSSSKLKAIDFYRKIPRDLTEASLSGAGLSIIAAFAMVFLFGMVGFPNLSCEFLSVDVHDVLGTVRQNLTRTVRKYPIDSNMNRVGQDVHVGHLPTIRNHGDHHGDEELAEGVGEGAVELGVDNFDTYAHEFPILLVNFYAGWCSWSQRLKPSWEKAAQIIHESAAALRSESRLRDSVNTLDSNSRAEVRRQYRSHAIHPAAFGQIWNKNIFFLVALGASCGIVPHVAYLVVERMTAIRNFNLRRVSKQGTPLTLVLEDDGYHPDDDGRIMLGKVDCAEARNQLLCRSHHIQGYPSIRVFRKGQDVRDAQGRHDHDSYYGERDTDSLVAFAETLVPVPTGAGTLALEDKSENNSTVKRSAPKSGGCRVEGFAMVKKVPGSIIIAARSTSHSFDAAKTNMSHYVQSFFFGRKLSYTLAKEVYRVYPLLDGVEETLTGHMYTSPHENITFDHYLQAVKTEVISLKSSKDFKLLEEYNFVAHSAELQTADVPVAKFQYELSPMQVLVSETPKSFSHFITNVCAIIGGVFTVAGIIDSMLHSAIRMVKKVELGKQY
ncbi:hypothetical protein AXG93_4368s1640 [Marchantia polymorpha subsp. ruderalis]|uniref:Thioredoxin domain-containing protein n=1 Tax=Marchantia polymorpha subsp. ruderalis TaxID=1480154 RepID=A0A176VY19_MARPO|nr:hypothetical protein AXG93_4368s1640 [Marchantia polymorpha subsp. ruderalis]